MTGMTATAASNASSSAVAAPITFPDNAAALAAAHTPFPAALPPTAGAGVRHFTITLKDGESTSRPAFTSPAGRSMAPLPGPSCT